MDLVYFMCVDGREQEQVDEVERALEGPVDIRAPKTQEERIATILEMGGGVA